MKENSVIKNMGTIREGQIKARAFFDAIEYVKLMETKSPDNLKLQPNGTLILNVVEGDSIFSQTKTSLNLTTEEMGIYVINLLAQVKSILLKKPAQIAID